MRCILNEKLVNARKNLAKLDAGIKHNGKLKELLKMPLEELKTFKKGKYTALAYNLPNDDPKYCLYQYIVETINNQCLESYFCEDYGKLTAFVSYVENNFYVSDVKMFSFDLDTNNTTLKKDLMQFVKMKLKENKIVSWNAMGEKKVSKVYMYYLREFERDGYRTEVKFNDDEIIYIIYP